MSGSIFVNFVDPTGRARQSLSPTSFREVGNVNGFDDIVSMSNSDLLAYTNPDAGKEMRDAALASLWAGSNRAAIGTVELGAHALIEIVFGDDSDDGWTEGERAMHQWVSNKSDDWRDWADKGVDMAWAEGTRDPVMTNASEFIVGGVSGGGLFDDAFRATNRTTRTNFNQYEAIFESPITGTSRSAHRNSANSFFANQLENTTDLQRAVNNEFRTDVLQHMNSGSGRNLLNPPGTQWHHPIDNPNVMQLLRTGEHTNPMLQPVLHPGPNGTGGFGTFF